MKLIPRQSTFHFKGEFKLIFKTILSRDWKKEEALSELEQRFAEYIGCKYAIVVPSATFGIYQILKALVKEKNEVICPAFTHHSIPLTIISAGATPIFADVDYETFNIDIEEIENKLTDKTRGIVVLHFGGQVADLENILKIAKRYNLFVVSDCAHACGAEFKGKRLGGIEDAACFGFGTGKNLDGFGGGAVTTNNDYIAGHIRESMESLCRWPTLRELTMKILRAYIQWLVMKPIFFHLFTFPLIFISTVVNKKKDILYELANIDIKKSSPHLSIRDRIRFSNLQAKIVLKQLDFLDARINKTRENAHLLSEKLSGIKNIGLPKELPETRSVFLLYPVKVKDKHTLSFKLLKQGIDTRKDYFFNLSELFKIYSPITEKLVQELLYLPVYPELKKDDIIRIAESIRRINE